MSVSTPTTRDLLARMLAKVEEMRRALDAAAAAGATEMDSARAGEALDELERRVRALMDDAV
jgi:hypothetical protein